MSTDQEFWEKVAVPASRVLLYAGLNNLNVTRAISNKEKTIAEFAADIAAEVADRLLIERNLRLQGHPTNVEAEA
jgi:hypothetical protein